jgi:hypothetical protein
MQSRNIRPCIPYPINAARTGPPLEGPRTIAVVPSAARADAPPAAFKKFRRPILRASALKFIFQSPHSAGRFQRQALLRKPLVQSLPDKLIVIQVRIGCIYPAYLLILSWAESFSRVQAPDAFEQSLPSQHFKKSGIAAGKVIRCIKKCRIGIGNFDALPE